MYIVYAYKHICAYKIYFCIWETDQGDLFETESDNSNKPEWTLQSCFHPLFWVLKSWSTSSPDDRHCTTQQQTNITIMQANTHSFLYRHDPTGSFFIPTQLLTHLIINTKVVLFYTWQSVNLYMTDLKPHKCHQDHCKLFQERQQTLQTFWYCFYLWQMSQQLVSVRTVHTGSSITT